MRQPCYADILWERGRLARPVREVEAAVAHPYPHGIHPLVPDAPLRRGKIA
jgi:hypothetical protein